MKGKMIAAVGILFSSLLVGSETTNVPCQVPASFSQGDQALPNKECLPSYGYPGGANLGQDYQFFVTASYTYWYSGEDGLDVATTAAFQSLTGQVLPSEKEMGVISQDFGYSSGFKTGLGMYFGFDAWELSLDYTYYRREATQSASAPSLNPEQGTLLTTNWFLQSSSSNQAVAGQKLSSKWKLGMDWVDATLDRPFYQGRSLTVRPFFGLRSAWIRQRVNVALSEIVNVTSLQDKQVSRNHSNSWAIGPRAGVGTCFLLGYGLNFQADFGASLLYTQYTTVKHSEGALVAGATPVSYSMNNQNTLRPMTELSLGLGWGSYFCSQAYHFNIDATYDFNYLWSQNMIRQLNDMFILGAVGGPGDLFLHGLTVKARFDF